MSQLVYVNAEVVTATDFRLLNPCPDPVAVELKVWLTIAGLGSLPYLNTGSDGSFVLPGLFDLQLGPLPLFPVDPGFPRGIWEFSSRMLDWVTGQNFSEDLNPFEIQ